MRLAVICILIAAVTVLVPAGATHAAEHGGGGGEKKKGGGLSFLQLPTLTASLMRPGGRRGVLTVEAGLDIADDGLHGRAESSIPRLRDSYVRVLATYSATLAPGAPPNPETISVALQRSTDQVLGKPGAKLLLGTVMIN